MEAAGTKKQVPVREGLFELAGGDEIRLCASECNHCDRAFFPRAGLCPYCGETDVEPVLLDSQAAVIFSTVVSTPPPGFTGPVPFGLAVVRYGSGLELIAPLLCTSPLAKGAPVRSVAWVVGTSDHGAEIVTYAFRPLEVASGGAAESAREVEQ